MCLFICCGHDLRLFIYCQLMPRMQRNWLIIGNPRDSASADHFIASYAVLVSVDFGAANPAICARKYLMPALVSDEVTNISG